MLQQQINQIRRSSSNPQTPVSVITHIKCVICEAELPDTTGVAVFEALAKQHFHPPFALLVSRGGRRIFEKAERIGIAHVLSKPLVNHQLAAFVLGA